MAWFARVRRYGEEMADMLGIADVPEPRIEDFAPSAKAIVDCNLAELERAESKHQQQAATVSTMIDAEEEPVDPFAYEDEHIDPAAEFYDNDESDPSLDDGPW